VIVDLETVPFEPNYLPLADLSSWSYTDYADHTWIYQIGTGAVCRNQVSQAEGILTNSYVGPHALTVGLSRIPGTASGVRFTVAFRQRWELSGAFDHPECTVLPEYNQVIPTFSILGSKDYFNISELMLQQYIDFPWQTLADGITSWSGTLYINIQDFRNPGGTMVGPLNELLLGD